jgi:hypothetical protein
MISNQLKSAEMLVDDWNARIATVKTSLVPVAPVMLV